MVREELANVLRAAVRVAARVKVRATEAIFGQTMSVRSYDNTQVHKVVVNLL